MVQRSAEDRKGFFASLFDFSFTSFITLRFLRLIYAVLVVLLCVAAVFGVGVYLAESVRNQWLAIVILPTALLGLVVLRLYFEFVALFFRIGEDTSDIARCLQTMAAAPPHPPRTPAVTQLPPPPPAGWPESPDPWAR
jgi:hypothetical protein